MSISIKDAPLVEKVKEEIKIPISDGSGTPKSINISQIKDFSNKEVITTIKEQEDRIKALEENNTDGLFTLVKDKDTQEYYIHTKYSLASERAVSSLGFRAGNGGDVDIVTGTEYLYQLKDIKSVNNQVVGAVEGYSLVYKNGLWQGAKVEADLSEIEQGIIDINTSLTNLNTKLEPIEAAYNKIKTWFTLIEDKQTLVTEYNLASKYTVSSLGIGEGGNTGGSGFSILQSWEDDSDSDEVMALGSNLGRELYADISVIKNENLKGISSRVEAVESGLDSANRTLTTHNTNIQSNSQSIADINDRITPIEKAFNEIRTWFTLEGDVLRTTYSLASDYTVSSLGVGSDNGGSGVSYNRLDNWDNYVEGDGSVLSSDLGYGLLVRIIDLEESSSGDYASIEEKVDKNTNAITNLSTSLNDFLTGVDVDDTINRWKELEKFLEGYTETATLADLLKGKVDTQVYNTAINGINETLGTHTSAINSNAANITSINTTLLNHDTRITNNANAITEIEKTLADWFTLKDGVLHSKYGLASDKTVSSLGVGSSEGGGVSYNRLDSWDIYTADKAGYVLSAALGWDLKTRLDNLDLGDFDLSGYLTKSEAQNTYATISALNGKQNAITANNKLSASLVSGLATVATSGKYGDLSGLPTFGSLAFKDSLTASDIPSLSWSKITSDKPTTLDGYGITDALPLIGGELSGDLTVGEWLAVRDVIYAHKGLDVSSTIRGLADNDDETWSITDQGAASFSDTLTVQGKAELQSGLDVIGLIQGLDSVGGDTTWKITSDGAATFGSKLKVTGTTTLEDKLTISKNGMSVTGAASFENALSVSGESTFKGKTTHNGGIGATSGTFSTTLGVTGATSLKSTLSVTGATTLSSTLGVTGDATFNSKIYIGGKDAYIYWDAAKQVLRTNVSFASNKTVSSLGVGTSEGGGAGSVIDLTNVVSDIIPSENDYYSIGSLDNCWTAIYVNDVNASVITEGGLRVATKNWVEDNFVKYATLSSYTTKADLIPINNSIMSLQQSTFTGAENENYYRLTWFTSSGGNRNVDIPTYQGKGFTNIEDLDGVFMADYKMVYDILDYVDNAVGEIDLSEYATKTHVGENFLSLEGGTLKNTLYAKNIIPASEDYAPDQTMSSYSLGDSSIYDRWNTVYAHILDGNEVRTSKIYNTAKDDVSIDIVDEDIIITAGGAIMLNGGDVCIGKDNNNEDNWVATRGWVREQGTGGGGDLSNYYTKGEADANFATKATTLDGYGLQESLEDLNYPTPNTFFKTSDNTPQNAPVSTWGVGFTLAYNNDWAYQTQLFLSGGHIYTRQENGSVWSEWNTLLDSTNYSSYALPLSGGTIDSPNSIPLVVNSTSSNSVEIRLQHNSGNKVAFLWDTSNGSYLYSYVCDKFIGILDDGTPYYYKDGFNTLIHSGNIGDYALPKTGGQIYNPSHNAEIDLKSSGNNTDSWLYFTDAVTTDIYGIGIRRPVDLYGFQYREKDKFYKILHTGNLSDYALPLEGGVLGGEVYFDGKVYFEGETVYGFDSIGGDTVWSISPNGKATFASGYIKQLKADTFDLGGSVVATTDDLDDFAKKATTLAGYGITDGVLAGAIELTNSDYTGLQDWADNSPSFVGSLHDKTAWYNVISLRHRNGTSDGNEYGMLLYSQMTVNGASLKYIQQMGGTWDEKARTILDSSNFSDYALPLSGGTMKKDATIKFSNQSSYRTTASGLAIFHQGADSSSDSAFGGYNAILHVSTDYYRFQIVSHGGAGNNLAYRNYDSNAGKWENWEQIIHSGNIGSQSVNYANSADYATAAKYIRPTADLNDPYNLPTVKSVKDTLVSLMQGQDTGIGDNIVISSSVVGQWNDDSASTYYTSVHSVIKIGGGYGGSAYGQWLLSSYGDSRVGYVGRNENVWGNIHWLATLDDIYTRQQIDDKISALSSGNAFTGGSVVSTIYPSTSNGASLGTSNNKWAELYVSNINAGGTITAYGNITTSSGSFMGSTISISGVASNQLAPAIIFSSYGEAFDGRGNFYLSGQSGDWNIFDQTIERVLLRIRRDTGNVLIGTTTDSGNKLHVEGSIYTPSGINSQYIELNTKGELPGHGGFIDFHFNGSSDDYTSRIIEKVSGKISIVGNAEVEGALSATGGISAQGNITTSYGSFVGNLSGTASNASSLGGVSYYNFSCYTSGGGKYLAFNLLSSELMPLGQGDGYIEYYDNGAWYNSKWGRVTANDGFVGNLYGNADTASYATSAGNASTLGGYSLSSVTLGSLYKEYMAFSASVAADQYWYVKAVYATAWRSEFNKFEVTADYGNNNSKLSIELGGYSQDAGSYIAKASRYNDNNVRGFKVVHEQVDGEWREVLYLKLVGGSGANVGIYSTIPTMSSKSGVVSEADVAHVSFTDVEYNNIYTNYKINGQITYADKLSTARTIWGQSFDGSGNVSGSITDCDFVRSTNISTDGYYIGLASLGAPPYKGLLLYTYGNTPITMYTSNTERLRILSNGNVLIGATEDSGAKMQINYDSGTTGIEITRTVNDEASIGYANGNTRFVAGLWGDDQFHIWNNENLFNITKGGNVLIGTTTDSGYKLDVNGTSRLKGDLTVTANQYKQAVSGCLGIAMYAGLSSTEARIDVIGADGNWAANAIELGATGNVTMYHNATVNGSLTVSGTSSFNDSIDINNGDLCGYENNVQNWIISPDGSAAFNSLTMSGPISFSDASANGTASSHYVSAGGGYSANSGKYGIKLVCCDQFDTQTGLGQDLTGLNGGYELTVAGGLNADGGYGYISFATHTVNSKTYRQLGYFKDYYGTISFHVNGDITSNGISLQQLNVDVSDLSGYYNDLGDLAHKDSISWSEITGKPSIPSLSGYAKESWVNTQLGGYATQVSLDETARLLSELVTDFNTLNDTVGGLAKVASTGSYNDLTNKPTIPSLNGYATQDWANRNFPSLQSYNELNGIVEDIDKNKLPYYATKNELAGHLPLSGGTVSGYTEFQSGVGTYNPNYASVRFTNADTGNTGWISYYNGSDWRVTNSGWTEDYTLIHSGNIGDYAISKNGGAVTGTLSIGSTRFNVGSTTLHGDVSLEYGALTLTHGNIGSSYWSITNDGAATVRTLSQTSDITKKNVISDIRLSLGTMANAPLIKFTWADGLDSRLHVGTIAQYWDSCLPEVVSRTKNDTLALSYGELGVAMGISLAKEMTEMLTKMDNTDSEVDKLKKRISELEKEIENLKAV